MRRSSAANVVIEATNFPVGVDDNHGGRRPARSIVGRSASVSHQGPKCHVSAGLVTCRGALYPGLRDPNFPL